MTWRQNPHRNLPKTDAQQGNEPQEKPDSLVHHGIKGQKWGVRRTKEQLGYKAKKKTKWRLKTKEERYEDAKNKLAAKEADLSQREEIKRRKEEIKRREERLKGQGNQNGSSEKKPETKTSLAPRSASSMSDQELRDFLNRYNLEKQYREATAPPKSKGAEWTKKVLINVGTTLVTKQLTKAGEAAIAELLKKSTRSNNNDRRNDRDDDRSGSGENNDDRRR